MRSPPIGRKLTKEENARIVAHRVTLTGDQPTFIMPILPPSSDTTPRPQPFEKQGLASAVIEEARFWAANRRRSSVSRSANDRRSVGQVADLGPPSSETDKLVRPACSETLRRAGIPLTLQRLAVAQVILHEPIHLTAEQVLARARAIMPEISRATVYNTLRLFADHGLVRELAIDAGRTVFDSNVAPHHHLYDIDTRELIDIDATELKLIGTPNLPDGVDLQGVDIVLRVRRTIGRRRGRP